MSNATNVVSADICIVGSGVAGIAVARRLIKSGLSVLLVESGGTKKTPLSKALSGGEHVGLPYWSLEYTRSRRFGGTAEKWMLPLTDGKLGLRLRPMDQIDFMERPGIARSGWPIEYDEVAPYFRDTDVFFKIDNGECWSPPNDESTIAPDLDSVRSVNFRFCPYDLFTKTYRKELQDSTVQVLLETVVTNINVSENGSDVRSLSARGPAGDQIEIKAKRYVLAGGGIEIPRLMLLSAKRNQRPIGTAMKNVGRYFMEHPHFLSGILIPYDKRWLSGSSRYVKHAYSGVTQMTKLAPSEEFVYEHKLVNFCAHLSRSASTVDHAIHRTRAYDALRVFRSHLAGQSMPTEISRFARDLSLGTPRLAYEGSRILASRLSTAVLRPGATHFDLHQMSEQLPNPLSRVTLGKTVDALGQQRARLDWHLQENDIRNFARGQSLLADKLDQAGVGKLIPYSFESFPPAGIRGGYHHMGTTRMSTTADTGVVNRDCRVHGTTNLFVAGSSVFSTGGFANPTYTLASLAIRLADHLRRDA